MSLVEPPPSAASELVALLRARGLTVAVAESLTGGLVAATLVEVPGASAVLRGGVVAYAIEVKHEVLGVPTDLLEQHGAVSAECALAMADGVRRLLRADLGVATTGVAGPDPSEGHPVGTVHLAVVGEHGSTGAALHLDGDRAAVRAGAVAGALRLVRESVAGSSDQGCTVVTPHGRGRRRDEDGAAPSRAR